MSKKKHRVRVYLRSETEVEMEVEAEEGDDPTDLTTPEELKAANLAGPGLWEVYRVVEVKP